MGYQVQQWTDTTKPGQWLKDKVSSNFGNNTRVIQTFFKNRKSYKVNILYIPSPGGKILYLYITVCYSKSFLKFQIQSFMRVINWNFQIPKIVKPTISRSISKIAIFHSTAKICHKRSAMPFRVTFFFNSAYKIQFYQNGRHPGRTSNAKSLHTKGYQNWPPEASDREKMLKTHKNQRQLRRSLQTEPDLPRSSRRAEKSASKLHTKLLAVSPKKKTFTKSSSHWALLCIRV